MRRILIALFLLLPALLFYRGPVTGQDTAPAADDVKILARYDFEDGLQGWHREEWEQYKPWNEIALEKDNAFQGSRQCLRTTQPNTWACLGPLTDLKFTDAGTKISFAYYTHHCTGVAAQARSTVHGNMHFTVQPFQDGEWGTGTVETAKFITWGGNSPSALGGDFSSAQIYASCDTKYSDHYFLLDNVVVWNGTDRTPPGTVTGLQAGIDWKAGSVNIAWKASDDNVGCARFHVYRSTAADFTPSSRNLINSATDVRLRDDTIPNFGTFYYRVTAEDFAGNVSEPSAACAVRVVEDI